MTGGCTSGMHELGEAAVAVIGGRASMSSGAERVRCCAERSGAEVACEVPAGYLPGV